VISYAKCTQILPLQQQFSASDLKLFLHHKKMRNDRPLSVKHLCAFREHRLALGLSYNRVAKLFQKDWTTIRRWELAMTIPHNPRICQTILDFIAGKYDRRLLGIGANFTLCNSNQYSPDSFCIDDLMYAITKHSREPKKCLELLAKIEKTTEKYLARIYSEQPLSLIKLHLRNRLANSQFLTAESPRLP